VLSFHVEVGCWLLNSFQELSLLLLDSPPFGIGIVRRFSASFRFGSRHRLTRLAMVLQRLLLQDAATDRRILDLMLEQLLRRWTFSANRALNLTAVRMKPGSNCSEVLHGKLDQALEQLWRLLLPARRQGGQFSPNADHAMRRFSDVR
jgi:hypothetical protein